ncbi:hypothetical protein J4E89_006174, partial [Alternaria sp. Ai002NY15]
LWQLQACILVRPVRLVLAGEGPDCTGKCASSHEHTRRFIVYLVVEHRVVLHYLVPGNGRIARRPYFVFFVHDSVDRKPIPEYVRNKRKRIGHRSGKLVFTGRRFRVNSGHGYRFCA